VKDAVILLPLVRELAAALPRLAPQAVTIVMSNPVDAISYHLCRLSGLRKGQFAGFSYNDVIRARWGIGRMGYTVSPGLFAEAVSCAVVGEHGASKVPLFSSAQVNGGPANLSSAQIEIIQEENRNWWEAFLALEVKRTAGWTSAAGVTVMLEHLAGIRQAPICCSCVLEGELGYDGLSMGVEARLASGGVAEILPLRASAEEKAAIDASAWKIQSAIAALGSLLEVAK
jgi:malate dehydrogenase